MKRPFSGTFPITQEWGVNPADYARFGLQGHNGIDYGTPTGTSIIAPHDGIVIEVVFDEYGYGMYVKIENDFEGSILAHLKSANVNPGDKILEGQQIGISDNTGNSTGSHLHWGYYRKPRNKSDGYSGTTNPFPYLTENQPQVPPTNTGNSEIEQLKAHEKELNTAIEKKDKLIGDQSREIEESKVTNTRLNTDITTITQQKVTFQTENDTLLAENKLLRQQQTTPEIAKMTNKQLLIAIYKKIT